MCVRVVLVQVLFASIFARFILAYSASASCKDSWVKWSDSCYKFFPILTNWQNASAVCLGEGATLVTILSVEENDFVKSLMQGKAEVVWIDLRRENQEPRKFVWYSGDPVSFENWKHGEPTNSSVIPQQDCVYMNKNGSWEDNPCVDWQKFICKIGPVVAEGGGHELSREESYLSLTKWALVHHVVRAREASSELECAWFCLNEVHCESFNYKPNDKRQCELNGATAAQYPTDFVRQPGSTYFTPRM